ncbi:MAG: dTDP-4-dehydrorhamnose 3,5-epimerase [Candidatus Nanohaloarchaea archaeon]
MPFEFEETRIEGVKIAVPEVFQDKRGFFMEAYVEEDFKNNGINNEFIQDNHSKSKKGTLRGLHFQEKPYAQAKLVRCTKGKIFDVSVDLRKDSPTLGEHVSVELSANNRKMIFIPRGFAHGFLALSETAEAQYKVDNSYAPDKERGIIWDDSNLDIDWPIDNPKLSDRDQEWPTFVKLKEKNILF